MKPFIAILLSLLLCGCSQPQPSPAPKPHKGPPILLPPIPPPIDVPAKRRLAMALSADAGKAVTAPKALWLTWSNPGVFIVNVVDYKTDLAGDWQLYGYVTNGFTNAVWLRLQPTNAQCFFRVGRVPGWW